MESMTHSRGSQDMNESGDTLLNMDLHLPPLSETRLLLEKQVKQNHF